MRDLFLCVLNKMGINPNNIDGDTEKSIHGSHQSLMTLYLLNIIMNLENLFGQKIDVYFKDADFSDVFLDGKKYWLGTFLPEDENIDEYFSEVGLTLYDPESLPAKANSSVVEIDNEIGTLEINWSSFLKKIRDAIVHHNVDISDGMVHLYHKKINSDIYDFDVALSFEGLLSIVSSIMYKIALYDKKSVDDILFEAMNGVIKKIYATKTEKDNFSRREKEDSYQMINTFEDLQKLLRWQIGLGDDVSNIIRKIEMKKAEYTLEFKSKKIELIFEYLIRKFPEIRDDSEKLREIIESTIITDDLWHCILQCGDVLDEYVDYDLDELVEEIQRAYPNIDFDYCEKTIVFDLMSDIFFNYGFERMFQLYFTVQLVSENLDKRRNDASKLEEFCIDYIDDSLTNNEIVMKNEQFKIHFIMLLELFFVYGDRRIVDSQFLDFSTFNLDEQFRKKLELKYQGYLTEIRNLYKGSSDSLNVIFNNVCSKIETIEAIPSEIVIKFKDDFEKIKNEIAEDVSKLLVSEDINILTSRIDNNFDRLIGLVSDIDEAITLSEKITAKQKVIIKNRLINIRKDLSRYKMLGAKKAGILKKYEACFKIRDPKEIFRHIRDALAHGNVRFPNIINAENVFDTNVTFSDYNGPELTYKASVSIRNMLKIILNSEVLDAFFMLNSQETKKKTR